MERESLLAMLIVVLAGIALQLCGAWPSPAGKTASAAELERRSWLRIWAPSLPAFVIAAWLCGWALAEPDPVPDPLNRWVLIVVCVPFALLFARAVVRAAWSLLRVPTERGVATVGLIQPQVVVSPFLARRLDDRALGAALEHERAHAQHRDPLRIWLAQWVTDLQWPWPAASARLEAWLSALECARDDEARSAGVDGADLAAAVLASVRYVRSRLCESETSLRSRLLTPCCGLIDEPSALRARVSRLLEPPAEGLRKRREKRPLLKRAGVLLIPLLLSSAVLGDVLGERVMHYSLGLLTLL